MLSSDPAPPALLVILLTELSQVVPSVWRLEPQAFRGNAGAMALVIPLLAGLSQAIGQAFILFLNRVRPLRFVLSLMLEAVLFTLGFLVWALSTWMLTVLLFHRALPLTAVIRALGIAHAPQLLAFLGALPYLGSAWLSLLSLWTAITFVVGLTEVTGLSTWSALACLIGGWLTMHALQRTAGQPLGNLGRRLQQSAAGVQLDRNGQRLVRRLDPADGPDVRGRPRR